MEKYDLVVIGSGPGGYLSAIRASQLGMRVAVVERDKPGGICLNWGCIPSKSILKCAEIYEAFKNSTDYGITVSGLSFDYSQVIEKSRKAASTLSKGVEYLFKKNKIELIPGTASFLTNNKIAIQGVKHEIEIEASHTLVATGSSPKTIPGLEIDGTDIMTSDQAIICTDVPKSIAIIGGGAVGVEFAYIYRSFGSEVTVVELEDQLLPGLDGEASSELEKHLKRMGIKILTKTKFSAVKKIKNQLSITLDSVGKKVSNPLKVEKILVAVGRQAVVDPLLIDNAGIELDDNGFIKTNGTFSTTSENIFAIGDVIGPPLLAHKASEEGVLAVEIMSGLHTNTPDYSNIPSCIYCQPEVATLGLSEEECRERGFKIDVGKFPMKASGKAVATGDTKGFVKLIADSGTGEILGAHIVGHGATELIGEIALGRKLEATPYEISETSHAHPTLSEAIMEAALDTLGRARNI